MDSDRRVLLCWFAAGVLTAAVLQFAQAAALGGHPSALLAIGNEDPVSDVVEAEIDNAAVLDGLGHDGQVYYAMALDPLGKEIPTIMSEPGYRYRRILYPALGGAFGSMGGTPLLWSMIVLNAFAAGAAAAALASLGVHRGWPAWTPALVVANPGVWLAVRLLTPDILALATALWAVAAYLAKRPYLSSVLLAAAVLAKEPYAAFAVALVAHALVIKRNGKLATLVGYSLLPAVAWWLFVRRSIGGGILQGGNVDIPGKGIIEGMRLWIDNATSDVVLAAITVISLLTAVVVVRHHSNIWSWLVVPWIMIAMLSSHFVWDYGNNAIRAFLPLLILQALAVIEAFSPTAGEGAQAVALETSA